MRVALRTANVLVALVTLASALAVLVSDLVVPGYRAHYRDALWFVTAYAAVQGVMVVAFARDGWLVPWLALARAAAAWLFLAAFTSLWPYWATWTPARYVYQLCDWGAGVGRTGVMAFILLGRGAASTLNALYFTQPWWWPLRVRRPLLGRLITALPIGLTVLAVWAFLQLVREQARTFSAEAQEVAEMVLASLDCDSVRTKAGTTTTDLRKRGERTFEVAITWGCELTRVVVRGDDERLGVGTAARPECCAGDAGNRSP